MPHPVAIWDDIMCTVCWDEDAECLLLFLTDWGSLKTVAEGRKEGEEDNGVFVLAPSRIVVRRKEVYL